MINHNETENNNNQENFNREQDNNNFNNNERPESDPAVAQPMESNDNPVEVEQIQISEEFNYIDNENEVGSIQREVPRSGTKKKAFGVVIYGDRTIYTNDINTNKNIHIHGEEENKNNHIKKVIETLENIFKNKYQLQVNNIILGHEHGTTNGKCHYQIVVELKEETQKNIMPGKFKIGEKNHIFMAQKARNNHALKQYCKKDGDVYSLREVEKIKYIYKINKKGEETTQVDPYATAHNNPHLTAEEKMGLIIRHDPRTATCNYKNIEYCFQKTSEEIVPEFEWKFPDRMMTDSRYSIIKSWFFNYCQPANMDRRKALVIHGYRGSGKSRFAEELVNHPVYRVSFSGNFNNENVKGKKPELLILDDINHYNDQNKEAWKRLCVGQPTNIRDAYTNLHWPYSVPCIIVTNNKNLFANLMLEEEFRTQCIFYNIGEGAYIGPEGTQPEKINTVESDLTAEMAEFIQWKKQQRESKFKKVDDEEELLKKRERSRDKDIEIQKLKKENDKLRAQVHNYKRFLDASCPSNAVTISNLFTDK